MTAPPIVITGCPRSGTTWAGTTVGYSDEVMFLYEPMNDDAPHHIGLPERYIYVAPGNHPGPRGVDDLVALGELTGRIRLAGRALSRGPRIRADVPGVLALRELRSAPRRFLKAKTACIKDPLAFFAAEWLEDRYGARVVVMVRHPAGMISSYIKLRWANEVESLLRQPGLAARLTPPLQADVDRYRANPEDELFALILQWKLFAQGAIEIKRTRPSWLFMSHETLCEQPVERFREMFDYLGLRWTRAIEARVIADSTAGNQVDPAQHRQHVLQRNSKAVAEAWRGRMEPTALARIETETAELYTQLRQLAR